MKSFLLIKPIAILFFLASSILQAFSQDPNYPIYQDTLVVGDTCILRQDPGYCSPDQLVAMLSPDFVYWPEYCPDCNPDTIFSFKTELVPGIDTAFYFYFIIPIGTLSGGYGVIHLCDGSPMHF